MLCDAFETLVQIWRKTDRRSDGGPATSLLLVFPRLLVSHSLPLFSGVTTLHHIGELH
jgi:hypothetical protein